MIEAEQLVPLNGRYVLKVAEPMDEVTYLDRLQLVVLDHPADIRVYPDERLASSGPQPSQDLLALRQEVFPVKARDHRGRDVTNTLRHRDRDTVSDFARRSWLGLAEDHWVEGGLGEAVLEALAGANLTLAHLAVREMPGSGKPEELLNAAGIDASHIADAVRSLVR